MMYYAIKHSDTILSFMDYLELILSLLDLVESVFSAPFYLENLLDSERFPNYQINDPLQFLNSLMLVSPLTCVLMLWFVISLDFF